MEAYVLRKGVIIISLILLAIVSSGFVLGAKPRVIVLSNSIDFELASEFFGFLGNKGMDVVHVSANDFEAYKEEKFIVILGGPDAYDGVGDIVQEVLTADEQEYIRASGNRKMFTKTNVWTTGQRVSVIAGSDRTQTKFAHVENRDDVVSSVNEATDQTPTTPVPTTTAPQPKSKELSLKWTFKDSEYYIGDNQVNSIYISNDGRIGAKFESGYTYVIDENGKDLWHRKVTGPISYAFYLYDGGDSETVVLAVDNLMFSKLSNERTVRVSGSNIQLRTKEGGLITSHNMGEDKVRDLGIITETADIARDGRYLIVTSHTVAPRSVMTLYPISSEIQREWYYYSTGVSFYTAKISPNSKYIVALTASGIDLTAYGWLNLYDINSEKIWGKNLATRLNDVDISQEGECIATVDSNWNLYLLNSQGDVILTENMGGNSYSVALAPDCSYLVVGVDDSVKFYEITE